MIKLIHAGIRRYLRSVLFWFAVIATICNAAWCGYYTKCWYFSTTCIIIELIIFAILISWLTGRELNEGIFRNKVISGYTKAKIFFSEIILGTGACLLLFLIFAVIFTAYNSYVFTFVTFEVLTKIFIDVLLINLIFAAISVTLSCLIPHMAASIIINVVFAVLLIFISCSMTSIIYQTEYVEAGDENYTYEEAVRSTNDSVSKVYKFIYHVLPYSHIVDYSYLSEDWFGSNAPDTHTTQIAIYNDARTANTNLIYSIFVLVAICGIGALCFSKNDLK